MPTLSARDIIMGNPRDPDHQPPKGPLVQYLERLEQQAMLSGGVVFADTLSELEGITPPAGTSGFVLADPDPDAVGVYIYDGSDWTRTADLPPAFAGDVATLVDLAAEATHRSEGDIASRERTNHTGTQAKSTVEGLVDDLGEIDGKATDALETASDALDIAAPIGEVVHPATAPQSLVIHDPAGWVAARLGPEGLALLGQLAFALEDPGKLILRDKAGFVVFRADPTGIRHMGAPIVGQDIAAEIASVTGLLARYPRPMQRWRHARAGVVQGLGRARIACIGDSNTMGHSALGNNNHRRAYSYPAALARLLPEYRPSAGNVFGNTLSGSSATPAGDYQAYDPRVTAIPSGWSLGGAASVGGFMWANSTTTGAVSFTPAETWDTAEVWVACPSGAELDIGIPGDRDAYAPAADTLVKLVYTAPSSAAQALEIARTSGDVRVIGWHCYDSNEPGLDILNVGRSGWRSDQHADDADYFSPLSALPALDADLWIVQLGLNDINQGYAPSNLAASLTAILDAAADVDVPVVLSISMTPGITSPVYPWQAYRAVILDLADSYGCPVLDIGTRLGPYAEALADALVANNLHPNAYGYAETARLVTNLINS